MTDTETDTSQTDLSGEETSEEEMEIDDDPKRVQKSFYMQDGTKKDLERFIKRLELDHPELVDEAYPRHKYEAFTRVSLQLLQEHEEEFLEALREARREY